MATIAIELFGLGRSKVDNWVLGVLLYRDAAVR
jgi:hypothetical protein